MALWEIKQKIGKLSTISSYIKHSWLCLKMVKYFEKFNVGISVNSGVSVLRPIDLLIYLSIISKWRMIFNFHISVMPRVQSKVGFSYFTNCCQISNIRHTRSQNLNVSRLVLQFPLPSPLKPVVENEDVVGAALTGDAPTTSECSTVLLPTKVHLISVVWRYIASSPHTQSKRHNTYFNFSEIKSFKF